MKTTSTDNKVHPEGVTDDPSKEKDTADKPQDMRFYLMPENTYIIIEKEWVMFLLLTTPAYLLHLFWVCWGVDAYSSYERHLPCGEYQTEEASSGLYDIWIMLCIIAHLFEWIRHTIFATSAVVGVNLIGVYYFMGLFLPFSIIFMFSATFMSFAADNECKE